LEIPTDSNLIVGLERADDAGVYKISEDLALVQTIDFFTPIVDDLYWFGQITAANVLQNKLEGKLEWLSPAEVKGKMETADDAFAILDVRDLKEVQEKRIPRSIWIPSEELEKRLGELDRDKELAVHCYSGVRSYKACLKLKHRGFNKVQNVDGGLLCWCYDLERKDGGE